MNFAWPISSLQTYLMIRTQGINCCGTVRQNCKGIAGGGFDNKTLKLEQFSVRCDVTAVIWKDKSNLHILTNMYITLDCGNTLFGGLQGIEK